MRASTLNRLRLERRGYKLIQWNQLSDCPVVSGPDLAKFLDISEQRIRQLTKQGMLKVGRGYYPLLGCVWWYLSYCRRSARVRRRSKMREAINKRKLLTLHYKTELLRIRLKKVSNEFAVNTIMEGRTCLLRSFDAQYRRLPGKFGIEFNWSSEQVRYFETILNEARNEFVWEFEQFFLKRIDRTGPKCPD